MKPLDTSATPQPLSLVERLRGLAEGLREEGYDTSVRIVDDAIAALQSEMGEPDHVAFHALLQSEGEAYEGPSARSASGAPGDAPHDWTEDFNHENGRYQCQCIECKSVFYGHKRRVVCKTCAARSSSAEPVAWMRRIGGRNPDTQDGPGDFWEEWEILAADEIKEDSKRLFQPLYVSVPSAIAPTGACKHGQVGHCQRCAMREGCSHPECETDAGHSNPCIYAKAIPATLSYHCDRCGEHVFDFDTVMRCTGGAVDRSGA